MNPEIKAEWIAALRSGDYTQGAFVLRSAKDEYCCLGVLCELAVKHEVIAPAVPYESAAGEYKYGDGEDWSTATLPKSVQDWAGLDSMWGSQQKDLADVIEAVL